MKKHRLYEDESIVDRLLPIIVAVFLVISCGTKVRVRSPVVFEKEMPSKEEAIQVSGKEPSQSALPYLSSLSPAKTSKPESIVLSLRRNINRNYHILGTVVAEDLSTWGFTRDLANQALKAKAYEVYGNEVDAIIGVEYEKRVGLLYSDNNVCRAFGTAIQFTAPIAPDEISKETTTLIPKQEYRTSSRAIPIIASSLPVNKDYEILGMVEVRNNGIWGFNHQSADKALRDRVQEVYGDKADAIIDVTYDKMTGLLYGKNNFYRASGTAIKFKVFWCPYCKHEINEESQYCSYCGKKLR